MDPSKQELAALESPESLQGNLRAISDDWNASLRGSRRWLIGTIGALVLTVLAAFVGVLWARRYRSRLRKRAEQISASIQSLRTQVAHEREVRVAQEEALKVLQQYLSETRKKEEDLTTAGRYVRGKIGEFVAPLEQRGHFEILLPSYGDPHLRILKDGRALREMDPSAAKILERIVRQSLLEQHRMSFSLFFGALYLWPVPEDLPKDPRGRWEVVVTMMRQAFESTPGEVISKGRSTIYEWMLDEPSYDCYVTTGRRLDEEPPRERFVTLVRAPYLEAKRLATLDPSRAARHAIDAFAAERDLVTKDVDVTMLACSLGTQASTALSDEQQSILRSAREELLRVQERYEAFFENYPSPDLLLHSAMGGFRRNERELRGHWDRFQQRLTSIKDATKSAPGDVAAPPKAIEKPWTMARHLVNKLGIARAQENSDFVDAFTSIRMYWAPITAQGALGKLTELTEKLDHNETCRRRFQDWGKHCLSKVVLAALENGGPSDRASILSALDAQLGADFWKSVEGGQPHILIEIVSGSDADREVRARVLFRDSSVQHDISGCVQVLAEIAADRTYG